jgi:hypothetical protein
LKGKKHRGSRIANRGLKGKKHRGSRIANRGLKGKKHRGSRIANRRGRRIADCEFRVVDCKLFFYGRDMDRMELEEEIIANCQLPIANFKKIL